jgi:hypothetical protein
VTDIVSAARRYVQFPAERVGRLPRWAVWMGGVLPVDGIWRITGRGVWLSPREADAAAEFIDRAGDELARAVTGSVTRGMSDDHPEKIRFASAGARGVQAGYDNAFDPKTAAISSRVINALATRVAAEVYDYRRSPARAKHVAVAEYDERLPMLRGRTIRQAVRGMPEDQMRVEALLRDWEYQSDLLAAAGKPTVDIAALRAELGLPTDLDGVEDIIGDISDASLTPSSPLRCSHLRPHCSPAHCAALSLTTVAPPPPAVRCVAVRRPRDKCRAGFRLRPASVAGLLPSPACFRRPAG